MQDEKKTVLLLPLIRGRNKIEQIRKFVRSSDYEHVDFDVILKGICQVQEGLRMMRLYDGSGTIACVFDLNTKGLTYPVSEKSMLEVFGSVEKGEDYYVRVKTIPRLGPVYNLHDFKPMVLFPSKDRRDFVSLEKLRQIPHQRMKATVFQCLEKIKQTMFHAIRMELAKQEIYEVQPTLLTTFNQDEARSFRATTLDSDKFVKYKDNPWITDFFRTEVFLAHSSQFNLEASILGSQRDSYCCSTVCKSDMSLGKLAESTQFEWEMLCDELEYGIEVGVEIARKCCKVILEECEEELEFLEKFNDNERYRRRIERKKYLVVDGDDEDLRAARFAENLPQDLISRLRRWAIGGFPRMSYEDCVKKLNKWVETNVDRNGVIEFGSAFSQMHRKLICMMNLGEPVVVTDFPEHLKSFSDAKTYEIIFPDGSMAIEGAQRIHELDELVEKMERMNVRKEGLEWYIQLRKNASAPHNGGRLRFEEFMAILVDVEDLRDLQEFPRSYRLELMG
jgi:asparaginyl-tRNA synthetase